MGSEPYGLLEIDYGTGHKAGGGLLPTGVEKIEKEPHQLTRKRYFICISPPLLFWDNVGRNEECESDERHSWR